MDEIKIYAIKVLSAILCGGLIGLERELSGKPAGLKTNILICMGSVIYMIVSEEIVIQAGTRLTDISRIPAQVVTGIGFIGAGCIIRYGSTIAGLTTAATIWVVAALGLLIGIGLYQIAIAFTLVVLIVLVGLRKVEKIFNLSSRHHDIDQPGGDGVIK